MRQQIMDAVLRSNLIEQNQHIVLGLSGGPDSVCLFYVLHLLAEEKNLTLHPVHINHKLRPGAAEEDQAYVEGLCTRLGWPLIVETHDCNAIAREQKITSEEAGRLVRYQAFRRAARQIQSAGVVPTNISIAVAHNADDQAETILFRILRGTGLSGLAGMSPKRDESGFSLIRPLLEVSKADILAFCEAEDLHPQVDATNLEPLYARNRIRLELLPLLETYNPKVKEALIRLGKIAGEEEELRGEMMEMGYEILCQEESQDRIVFDGDIVTVHPANFRRYIGIALKKLGLSDDITFSHYEAIGRVMKSESPSASCDLPKGYRIHKEYDTLVVEAPARERDGWELRYRLMSMEEYKGVEKPEYFAALDGEELASQFGDEYLDSLCLRHRQPGDVISIRGGRKKLQNLFVDDKVPKAQRDQILLVALGNQVLFLPAMTAGMKRSRYGQEFSATNSTKTVVFVEIISNT